MQNQKFLNTLGMAAASLGIIEGLVWSILAIIGIFQHFRDKLPVGDTHSKTLSTALVTSLKVKNQDIGIELTLDGTGVFVLAIAYLTLSLMWIGVSVLLIMSIRRNKAKDLKSGFLSWAAMTVLICIYDVAAAGLLGSNYAKVLKPYNSVPRVGTVYLILAYGVLFSLALRGYILWVVNLVLSIFMIMQAQRLILKDPKDDVSNMINAFDDTKSSSKPGYINQAYNFGKNFNEVSSMKTPSPTETTPIPRVAGLGKQGPRNYPQNIPPPRPPTKYIYPQPIVPKPDYSPPLPLKSALKNYQFPAHNNNTNNFSRF